MIRIQQKKEKTEICKDTIYNKVARKLSYFFEMPINYFAYMFLLKKYPDDTTIGYLQSFIPLNYYNNA